MATFLELFTRYDARRDEWQRSYAGSDSKGRRDAQKAAQLEFDAGLSATLGRALPSFSKNMSTVERAFKAAASKEEATAIYDAAVAKAATKYKPGGSRYRKATKTYEKYLNRTLSRFNTAAATVSTSTTSAVAGATSGTSFAQTNPANSTATSPSPGGFDFSTGALIVGAAIVGWWFFRK